MDNYDIDLAYEFSSNHRSALEKDTVCGCFFCLKIFSPSEIKEWCPEVEDGEEVTAICPYCDIDAVIGESSGFPITQELLKAMHKRWFGKDGIDA